MRAPLVVGVIALAVTCAYFSSDDTRDRVKSITRHRKGHALTAVFSSALAFEVELFPLSERIGVIRRHQIPYPVPRLKALGRLVCCSHLVCFLLPCGL